MRLFLVFIACLGVFPLLVRLFSLWTAFGIVYLMSMCLLIIIAFFGRREHKSGREVPADRMVG